MNEMWEAGYKAGKNGDQPDSQFLDNVDYEDGFITGRIHSGDSEETARFEQTFLGPCTRS